MRIAFFTNCYKPLVNGVVTSIASLKEAYERKGHETYVFAPQVEDYVDQEKDIFRYKSVNLTKKVKYPLPIPLSFKAKKIITEFAPDIIHLHHPFLVSIPATLYGEELGIPKILTLHTQYEQYAYYAAPIPPVITREVIKKIIFNLSYRIDCLTTPSASMKKLAEIYGIKNRIEVIPNALDLKLFRQKNETKGGEIKKRYHLKEEDKIILYVGRVAPEKNIDTLIKALEIVKRRGIKEAKLLIVGEGPAMEELKELVKSLQMEKEVIFAGAVNYEEIRDYYQIAYLFAIASTAETFGMVIIEALACGTPVLAVKSPGAVDILTEGVDGLLVDNRVEKFAEALEKIIRDPGLRVKLSQQALKTSENYDLNNISERMLNLYREVIERKNLERKGKKNFIKDILAFSFNYEGRVKVRNAK